MFEERQDRKKELAGRLIACAGLLLVLGSPARAQDGPGILPIFDQFVVSSAVASRCEKPEAKLLARFLANFETVSIYAAQELERRFPTRTREQIRQGMKRKSELITEKAVALVRQRGCGDAEVRSIVKRFYRQADWQPFGTRQKGGGR